MKVLMLNTFDEMAGAERAARRLLQGLRTAGVDVGLLVQFKSGQDKDVLCPGSPVSKTLRRLKIYLGTLPVRRYPNRPENNFSPALLPDRLPAKLARIAPDIVHLHWLGAGFCRIETLSKFNRPLVWTLHDSWPFTGGCHVPGACLKYRERCGACPVLGSRHERDLSRWTWHRKSRAWRDLNLTVVAPSRWLADCAGASSLFRNVRVEVIPNGLDVETFHPREKAAARQRLGLPQEKKIILFGAVRALSDPNKGFHLLRPALQVLGKGSADRMALSFSAFESAGMPDLEMPAVSLGHIRDDDQLATAYAAADVFVVPSIQESFCQTAAEALSCGTPVVAFGATGLLDVVEHQYCGYLARPYDVDDLARGIAWVLADAGRHAELAARARRKVVRDFALATVTRRYLDLYGEVLTSAAVARQG